MRSALLTLLLLAPLSAWGVPSPDTVVVVANGLDRSSVALAERYLAARDIPRRQLCLVSVTPGDDVDLATYQSAVDQPLRECLRDREIEDRIEAAVVMRGMPLRVWVPIPGGADSVSLTAALGLYKSTTSTGAPVLGRRPGQPGNCGVPCEAAAWPNPFRSGTFEPGWARQVGTVTYRPLLVTMIHGRTATEAAQLIASATTADAIGGAPGTFMFMDGADGARGVLDRDYDRVIAALQADGFSDAVRVPFQSDLTGRRLAAFFTGTAAIGTTIEGNTFLPGALVDNLTSYGALPANFARPMDEVQVSISRWVARGVAGVHGTTDEPLNNCFPARSLIVDYAEGGTLGEAYHRALPFVYWRNLVLGDPMTAPYKVKPEIELEGLVDGQTVEGSARLVVRTRDPLDRVVLDLWLYLDGALVAHSQDGTLDRCLALPVQDDLQVLAVAQIGYEPSVAARHRPKAWKALTVRGVAGPADCPPPPPDAGVLPDAMEALEMGVSSDAGVSNLDAEVGAELPGSPPDAGDQPMESGGCGCGTSGVTPPSLSFIIGWIVLGLAGRRGRR